MKSLTPFNETAIDNPNTEPIRVMTWTFLGGDLELNLCDRVWTDADGNKNLFYVQLGDTWEDRAGELFWEDTDDNEWYDAASATIYEPFIESWGSIKTGDIDPISHAVGIGEMTVSIINTLPIGGKGRFVSLFDSYQPQYSTITVSEFFFGAPGSTHLIDIFKGQVEDIRNIEQPIVTVVLSGNELDIANKFSHTILTRTDYASCRLQDVGKMLPQVYGRAQKVPFLGVSCGKATTLALDVTDSATIIDITEKPYRVVRAGAVKLPVDVQELCG